MSAIRVLLVHPDDMNVEAKLNLCGVQQLLEQEGIPFVTCPAGRLESQGSRGADVVVVAELECLRDEEEGAICEACRELPVVWCGVPREGASEALRRVLGVGGAGYSRCGMLRRLQLEEHAICGAFEDTAERDLKMKHVPHLIDEGMQMPGERVVSLCLMDGHALGPALIVRDEHPRRAVWTFPLGYLLALSVCRHLDMRNDMEWLDWPLMTYMDVLRRVLRETIRWCAPEKQLARKRYWPSNGGRRPAGIAVLSHDLCGYSEKGVEFVCETCAEYGVRTTFFDMPPLRLDAGEVGGNDIALHVSDGTGYEEIVAGLRELEDRHGREILGWRRHGGTEREHYPQVWRNMERAGVGWSNTFPTQSHPNRARCSPCGTGNRLPVDIMDIETGRRLDLLELPIFDTDDADRLSNIAYGMRLNWDRFAQVVDARLDFASKHGLVAGYLLHGWTAGVEREADHTYGALDAQRMLSYFIEGAKERGMTLMTGDEMYEWWELRRRSGIELEGRPSVVAPGDEQRLEVEVLEPFAK